MADQPVSVGGLTTKLKDLNGDGTEYVTKVYVAGAAAAAGDATAANQVAEQTLIGAVTETAPASDTASSGLNGRLQRLAQRITALIALFPTSIGQKATAASLSVTLASDDPQIGALTETAPATDTASSGVNGRLQRIAQRLTSLIAQIPATLGLKASAASMSVVIASDDAQIGTKVTAVTALGAGGTGLIGWLSTIANFVKGLPTALGVATSANSMPVVLASDDAQIGAKITAATMPTGGSGVLGWLSGIWLYLKTICTNPDVVTGTLTAVAGAGAPTLVSQLTAGTFIVIDGGTVDSITARLQSLNGGTGTVGFYGTDDEFNLNTLTGSPLNGAIGSGTGAQSGSAVGAWNIKGSSSRKTYVVCLAIGGGSTGLDVKLSATPNSSRFTAWVRSASGASFTAVAGATSTEAVSVQGIAGGTVLPIIGSATTVTTSFNRPGDTTAYAANDSISDSTSAPTAGGFTLASAGRVSGGSGIIVGMVIVSSNDPATTLQGEIWLYDSAATADNDNAAFASGDADTLKLVGTVPFTLATTTGGSGTTSQACVTGLNIPFTCVGTANLRFKVKAKNAYTPANAETISVRAQIVHTS